MGKKITDILKKEKPALFIKIIIMGLLPFVCCLIYCLVHNIRFSDIYLPASSWNDELIYYKQVEAMIEYGYPYGYFGFNESHALSLSFAAWSPVLLIPWVVWGKIFGWNFLSPIICNIVLLSVALMLFVFLTRLEWKKILSIAVLFLAFTPFVRFMLSAMPEVIVFSLVIIFYGLTVNFLNTKKTYKLYWLLFISGVLTLMRPYLCLLMLLPIYLLIREKKVKGGAIGGSALAVTVIAYALIKHFLGAEYFADLFFTDWLTTFFTKGLIGGMRHLCGILYRMGGEFVRYMIEGIKSGLAAGAYFDGYTLVLLILAIDLFLELKKYVKSAGKDGKKIVARNADTDKLILLIHLVFSFVAMFFAILLMYKLTEGSKHMLTFVVLGIFAIGFNCDKYMVKIWVLAGCFIFLYVYRGTDPYNYQVPVKDERTVASYTKWEECLEDLELKLDEGVPNYDNVCIWLLSDNVDGQMKYCKWQYLYGLKEGFGISCCTSDYVSTNLENLKSKYIAVIKGGDIDKRLSELNLKIINSDEEMVIYELH